LVLSASGGLESNQEGSKVEQKTITKFSGRLKMRPQKDVIERLLKTPNSTILIAVAMRKI